MKLGECIVLALAAIGLGFVIVFCFVMVLYIIDLIRDAIAKKKWEHIYKHRFDKPPLAKCYCRDCQSYVDDENDCLRHRWKVADNWFCWDAEPKTSNPKELIEVFK